MIEISGKFREHFEGFCREYFGDVIGGPRVTEITKEGVFGINFRQSKVYFVKDKKDSHEFLLVFYFLFSLKLRLT